MNGLTKGNLLTSISGGLVTNWVSVEKYGKLYAIFAPANEIKEDAEKFAYFSGDKKEKQSSKIIPKQNGEVCIKTTGRIRTDKHYNFGSQTI